MRISPYPGDFIHGINLDDWYPCSNIASSGRLSSPNFLAISDPGLSVSYLCVQDLPIEILKKSRIPMGVVSPRTAWYVSTAAIIRSGGYVGVGSIDTKWLQKSDIDRNVAIGDMELAFEEVRRNIAPNAVSRLACIWVAENTSIGYAHIRSMLGANTLILKVTIPSATGVSKVRYAWLICTTLIPSKSTLKNIGKVCR
ncbi:hypothetical protein [Nostoc piscinale]|uniref:hypothetical protein n=1 Tax=Nostoc piscinale TaxID=224012 RepID=UPI0007865C3E|nr:hypothetical protein [Nostoc piscinale]